MAAARLFTGSGSVPGQLALRRSAAALGCPLLDRPHGGKSGQSIDPADAVTYVAAQCFAGLFLAGPGQRCQDPDGQVELVDVVGGVWLQPPVGAAGA
jgi:hypothetical protein